MHTLSREGMAVKWCSTHQTISLTAWSAIATPAARQLCSTASCSPELGPAGRPAHPPPSLTEGESPDIPTEASGRGGSGWVCEPGGGGGGGGGISEIEKRH